MRVGQRSAVLVGVLVLLSGCKDQEARDEIAALKIQLDAAKASLEQVNLYIGKSDQAVAKPDHSLSNWTFRAHTAICSLESQSNPPAAKRLCPPGNLDHGGPPKPPPFL